MSEVDEGLEKAEQTLQAAFSGLEQYRRADGPEKLIGLRNTVINGRSVTWVLQRQLKGTAEGFEEWYEKRREVLKDDPVCSRMVEIRNQIEKEGETPTSTYATFTGSTADLQRAAPAWADSIFVGDKYGGSGFRIEREEEEDINFYYDFPDVNVEAGLSFTGIEDMEDVGYRDVRDAEEDLLYYLKVLKALVRLAKEEFGSPNTSQAEKDS